MNRFRIMVAFVAGVLASVPAIAAAADYPDKTIRMVVPFPPGGPTDAYARLIAQKLQEAWGQTVFVDNRPGGTGVIGTGIVRNAAPDGYTLLFTSNSAHVVGPLSKTPRPFDAVADFTPVSMVIRYPMYLLINPDLKARNIGEFIALAKANAGKFSYSSVGVGSGTHLACELFNMTAGTKMEHVPYQGAAPAQAAVISGEVQAICDSVGFSQRLVNAGKLRGLAVTGSARQAAVPDIPTLAEAGIPGVDTYTWLGLLGPAHMPADIVRKLNTELVRIMKLPDIRDRVLKEGSDIIADIPDEFAADMHAESVLWLRVIREKGIKTE